MQVAASAAIVGRHQEALQYIELWSASVSCSARIPTASEIAEHETSMGHPNTLKEKTCVSKGGLESELELAAEEAVLWSVLQTMGDADFSSGVTAIPKVHSCFLFKHF